MTQPTLARALALCSLAFAPGCAAYLGEEDELAGDVLVAPYDEEELGASSSALSRTQVIYLNFEGPVIRDCDSCSDSRTDRSFAIGMHWGRSQLDFAPWGSASDRSYVVERLRELYAPYRVEITTRRPSSGDYTMVVVSDTGGSNHGVAPLDCGNRNPNDIAFAYAQGHHSVDWTAHVIAHELGHSFGLGHVSSTADLMDTRTRGRSYARNAYVDSFRCGSGTQDAPALLAANLGRRESGGGGEPRPAGCGELRSGTLAAGQSVYSCDRRYRLVMQNDGNLVLYRSGGGALWATGTNGSAERRAVMQGDGNFVVYTGSRALWSSRTEGNPGAWLAVQNDANVVVYSRGGRALWARR